MGKRFDFEDGSENYHIEFDECLFEVVQKCKIKTSTILSADTTGEKTSWRTELLERNE